MVGSQLASYTAASSAGINCKLNLCWFRWQNHLVITLFQLLEHRYHVMHIRLPDRHNAANHFFLQVFLSEQSFPRLSMSCSSAVILLFSIRLCVAASSNFTTDVDIVQSHSEGFFCQQVLPMMLITFPSRPTTGTVVALMPNSSCPCIMSTNFRNVLPFYLICR